MKISIITATYNSASTVGDTLESVLAQTYDDWEHIIIDGASTDGTMDVIRSYEPRYKGKLRVVCEPDKGIYDAMNKGLAMATGEVLGTLNSDDIYHSPQVLEKIAAALEENKADCAFGDLVYVKSDDLGCVVRFWKGSQYKKNAFVKGWSPAHPTFYAVKRLYQEMGAFDLNFPISADFEMMLRFIEVGHASTVYVPHILVRMRMGGVSNRSIKNILVSNRNMLRAMRKNGVKCSPFFFVRRLVPKMWDMMLRKLKLRKMELGMPLSEIPCQ